MKSRLAAAVAYFAMLAYFIAGFLIVNLLVPPAALLTRGAENRRRRAARMVAAGLAHYRRLLRATRLVRFEDDSETLMRGLRGHVIVANHPSIFDAPLLLAAGEHITCFFKSTLRRTMLGIPAAQLAGYIPNDSGVAGILEASRRLRGGESIVIFPESTRSRSGATGEFHRAAATIAMRAGVPVTCLTFRYSSPLLFKAEGPLHPPSRLPLGIRIRKVATLHPSSFRDASALTAAMRRAILDDLDNPAASFETAPPARAAPRPEPAP